MCRIAGIASFEDATENDRKVRTMIAALAHGGPDDEGVYQQNNLTLGHRRLSIIDLSSAGHQPMIHRTGQQVISFNGEIYNYKELRAELQKSGTSFATHTDTEIIIEAYRTWGIDAFAKLRGIFAFAFYDAPQKKLLLVRDSPGVKPLYYAATGNRVVFASEVKAFKAFDPSWKAMPTWKPLFLAFGYLPHPFTTLDGVRQLTPGCVLEVNLSNLTSKEISYMPVPGRRQYSDIDAPRVVEDAVRTALKRNIISDAPLGVFLSGGIDSSLLTLLASEEIGDGLKTVSINFAEADFDEGVYQKMVLAKTGSPNHQQFKISEGEFWQSADAIWKAMDQPTIDGVNSYFVSMGAHRAGLKAVLSGLGADELFGGYASLSRIKWIQYLKKLPAKDLAARAAGTVNNAFRRLSFLKLNNTVGDYLFLRGIHSPSIIARILQTTEDDVWNVLKSVREPESSDISRSSYANFLEYNFYMKNQLLKDTDFMSMNFGLEVRVPFLDQDVIDISNRLPTPPSPKHYLIKPFQDVLPKEIIFRKKHGFTFPFHVWLKNRLQDGDGLLNDRLMSVMPVKQFLDGRAHWSQVWSGVVLDQFKYQ